MVTNTVAAIRAAVKERMRDASAPGYDPAALYALVRMCDETNALGDSDAWNQWMRIVRVACYAHFLGLLSESQVAELTALDAPALFGRPSATR